MIHQKKVLLENLGYDVNKPSYNFFSDVVEEVSNAMEIYSFDEVKEMVGNKKSYIYTELACFCYEVGLNNFVNELNQFHDGRVQKNNGATKLVFGDNNNPNLDDAIIKVSSYLNRAKNYEHGKALVKERKFTPSFNQVNS